MSDDKDARPGVDERYTSATHATNLKVTADKTGSVDLLIASAWSPTRLGSALLRLHSEWDGSARPRRSTKDAVNALADTMDGHQHQRLAKARKMADEWYLHEVALMMQRLKTLPTVRYQLTLQADRWLVDDPERTVAGILLWWLDHTCPHCAGLKFEKAPGAPSLSARQCRYCRGSGEIPAPYSFDGRRLVGHIQHCLDLQRRSIKKRLHP